MTSSTSNTTPRRGRRNRPTETPAGPVRPERCQVCNQGRPLWKAADRWRCRDCFNAWTRGSG